MDRANGGESSDGLEPIDLEWELGPPTSAPPPRPKRVRSRWVVFGVAIAAVLGVVAAFAFGSSDGETKAATPTTAMPSTPVTPAPTFREPIRIDLPAMNAIADAVPLYERQFPWGTSASSVGFTPGNQGASSAPIAFSADRAGSIAIFDLVNDRLVNLRDGNATTAAVDTRGFGPVPAVLDGRHRLITSDGSGGLLVFSADGAGRTQFWAVDFPALLGQSLSQLIVDGPDVFGANNGVGRLRLLHDDGTGYRPISSGTWQANPVQVQIARAPGFATIGRAPAKTPLYSLRAPWQILIFPATRLLRDGTMAAVVVVDQPPLPDGAFVTAYLMVTIDRRGDAKVERFPASSNYMDTGPLFQLEDGYFAVMSDTVNDGVRVAAYPYPETIGGE